MIFRAVYPERQIDEEVYAARVAEAAMQFAQIVLGSGWKMIKVFEAADGKSAIVLSPNQRPFKIMAIS